MADFTSFLDILDDSPFEETPVDIPTFIHSVEYLGLETVTLSEHQYTMVESMSMILKPETLIQLYGQEAGMAMAKKNFREVIFMLGKGSGRTSARPSGAYVVYLLLCMKADPAVYYGKPPGDSIDIINIAINALQANQVFFRGFKRLIEGSRWFQCKYNPKAFSIQFDKEITVYPVTPKGNPGRDITFCW